MIRYLSFFIFILTFFTCVPAMAQYCKGEPLDSCGSDEVGAFRYDDNVNAYAFCNGADWITVESTQDVTSDDACPGIGVMEYDTTGHYYRFCNHKDVWKKIGQGILLFGATCTGDGKIEYDTTYGMMKYCNGTHWVIMGQRDETLIPGDRCIDGSVYAGLSADGNRWMFAMPCDQGQTWNGTSCTGSRTGLSWNDGTATWTVTGFTSTSDGDGNSAGLAVLALEHLAARSCENLTTPTYSSWYLPAQLELVTLYNNRVAIGGFASILDPTGPNYWSSTEAADRRAIYKDFTTAAAPALGTKSATYNARCVRNEVPSALPSGGAEEN